MEANQTKLLATCTSKHFETNVVLMRNEVSRYLERGICIIDHKFVPDSVLNSQNLLFTLCKEIAKARGTPFVSVEFFRGDNRARVKMPLTVKAKPLSAHAMLLGYPLKDRGYYSYPIVIDRKTSGVDVYYNEHKGIEALRTWLMMCETDNAMRFALGLPPRVLPPKVSRPSSTMASHE